MIVINCWKNLAPGAWPMFFAPAISCWIAYVAIKVLRKDYSSNPDFQNHFRMEARSAANLSHPNIVTVHDFGFADNLLFIVMEFIPGKDLKQLIRERGRFSVEAGIPLIIQACAGLGYAHRAGLVHCDVKPHNMLVSPDGRLKVTDFGIARALATITPGERTDVVWGSPLYFAPEQAQGEAPSPASDVYSLGVVMYELLCGTPPFTASTSSELARLHISARPIPIREYIPDIPTALEEIIMKVLSKEPSARYRTADQLGRVLLKFGTQRDEPVPAITQHLHTCRACCYACARNCRETSCQRQNPASSVNLLPVYTQPDIAPQDAPEPELCGLRGN